MSYEDSIAAPDQVTECPQCRTTFLVTDDHLRAAGGKVRCGACLHVFRASDYFVARPAPTAQAAPEEPPQCAAPGGELEDGGELDFSDTFLALSGGDESASPAGSGGEDAEDWAKQLLEDDSPQFRSARNETLSAILGETEPDAPDESTGDEVTAGQDAKAGTGGEDDAPAEDAGAETWIRQLLGRDADDEEPAAATTSAEVVAPPPIPASPPPIDEPTEAYVPVVFRQGGDTESQSVSVESPMRNRLRDRIAHSSLGRRALPVGLAGAMLLLFVQLYAVREPIARIAAGNSWMHPLCNWLQCPPTLATDAETLRLEGITLFRHSRFGDRLMLTATLVNVDRRPQTYPHLDVTLTGSSEEVLLNRRFTPDEYLARPVDDPRATLGTQQQAAVIMALPDPGGLAADFELSLH